eukprot:2764731-Prymnesium_polylepis.1
MPSSCISVAACSGSGLPAASSAKPMSAFASPMMLRTPSAEISSAALIRATCCTRPSRAGGVATRACFDASLELAAAAGACSAGRSRAVVDVPGAALSRDASLPTAWPAELASAWASTLVSASAETLVPASAALAAGSPSSSSSSEEESSLLRS